uniref:Uncharacterized protein n=1 Tax=Tetranychus urticae TaxID=32264 RepID=T1KCQ4_TETUR
MDSERNLALHEHRDYLVKAIRDIRNEIELRRKENDILGGFAAKAELLNAAIEEFPETKDVSIQTEPIAKRPTLFHPFAYYLSSKEKLLKKRLNNIKLATNHKGPNCLLVKKSEFRAFISMIMSTCQTYERKRNKIRKLYYLHRLHR